VGSNIGAELGSMKVTEQIEAMEVSSTNPFKIPRGQPDTGNDPDLTRPGHLHGVL